MVRILKYTLLLLLAGLLYLSWSIWSFGVQDSARQSDTIIVLGAAINGDQPSPVFRERIHHGINLYQKGIATSIIFTGGLGQGESHTESAVAQAYAIALGVPDKAILIEEKSRTTQQNLSESLTLMQRNQLKTAIIVSDPLHLRRATVMANDLGIDAVSSPTPTSMYRSFKTQSEFLIRELYFYSRYVLGV